MELIGIELSDRIGGTGGCGGGGGRFLHGGAGGAGAAGEGDDERQPLGEERRRVVAASGSEWGRQPQQAQGLRRHGIGGLGVNLARNQGRWFLARDRRCGAFPG